MVIATTKERSSRHIPVLPARVFASRLAAWLLIASTTSTKLMEKSASFWGMTRGPVIWSSTPKKLTSPAASSQEWMLCGNFGSRGIGARILSTKVLDLRIWRYQFVAIFTLSWQVNNWLSITHFPTKRTALKEKPSGLVSANFYRLRVRATQCTLNSSKEYSSINSAMESR